MAVFWDIAPKVAVVVLATLLLVLVFLNWRVYSAARRFKKRMAKADGLFTEIRSPEGLAILEKLRVLQAEARMLEAISGRPVPVVQERQEQTHSAV
jgi:hypothetical protein